MRNKVALRQQENGAPDHREHRKFMEEVLKMRGIFCGPIILRVRAEVSSTGPFPCTAIASAWRAAAWQSTKNWRKWG